MAAGQSADDTKIKAILDMPTPEVRSQTQAPVQYYDGTTVAISQRLQGKLSLP